MLQKSYCSISIAFASRRRSCLEFSIRLCPTREVSVSLFGSIVKTMKCRNPEFGGAAHSLSGTPHWCLQDYMEVNQDSNKVLIPSGCSLWMKEVDDMPTEDIDVINRIAMKKLSEVSLQQQYVHRWILRTKECGTSVEGLNSDNHNLCATDYWCRQEIISLPFAGDNPFPSGCRCYVR